MESKLTFFKGEVSNYRGTISSAQETVSGKSLHIYPETYKRYSKQSTIDGQIGLSTLTNPIQQEQEQDIIFFTPFTKSLNFFTKGSEHPYLIDGQLQTSVFSYKNGTYLYPDELFMDFDTKLEYDISNNHPYYNMNLRKELGKYMMPKRKPPAAAPANNIGSGANTGRKAMMIPKMPAEKLFGDKEKLNLLYNTISFWWKPFASLNAPTHIFSIKTEKKYTFFDVSMFPQKTYNPDNIGLNFIVGTKGDNFYSFLFKDKSDSIALPCYYKEPLKNNIWHNILFTMKSLRDINLLYILPK